ncbi:MULTISPECIES: DUF4232 domain-containing protein [unclassified Streptomyces]|uniref:DUF4232 domain-containing protein n=1 Tax=unclassified Streptomyces TaxID=2593676 RepID=UPI002E78C7D8|nr:DUF4232 domain-containing protein [Streptomyces sp. JV190]MEE1845815.1 DUF4232 domain-containing protein [Streptomyces sp. JV190]
MRLRSALASALSVAAALALTGTAAASATPVSAPAGATSRLGTCQEKALDVRAAPGGQRNVARISVTNHGDRACVVDRIPTVTFRGLDGSADAVPPAGSGPYTLSAGERAYAAVRTAAPAATEGHVVGSLSVAADPSHTGLTFRAAAVGMPEGVHVWEPVTTLWQETQAAADSALAGAPR